MEITDTINWLSVLVLVGLLVALGFLIVLLYRANRVVAKLDHLSLTFRNFVEEIVPAIVNVGTIAKATQAIINSLSQKSSKDKDKKEK